MFNFLSWLFRNKTKEPIQNIEEKTNTETTETTEVKKINPIDKSYLCSLNFELNYDGTVNILCYWPNFDKLEPATIDNIASQYATMIFMMNNGLLKKDIVETLSDVMYSEEPFDAYFVHQVLSKWLEITEKTEQNKDNKPFIRPSSVFKNYIK
jgi:hypothetical protein